MIVQCPAGYTCTTVDDSWMVLVIALGIVVVAGVAILALEEAMVKRLDNEHVQRMQQLNAMFDIERLKLQQAAQRRSR